MDRLTVDAIAKPMQALNDLFLSVAKPLAEDRKWHLEKRQTFIDGLADLCYWLTYHFHLDEPDPARFDQYEPDFQKGIEGLLKSALPQGAEETFDSDSLHAFIETIVNYVLKLHAESYKKAYADEELGLLTEVTIAMIEAKIENLTYCFANGANRAYPNAATVPAPKHEYLPGMRPRKPF